jgi:hypothetical protein
MKKLLMKCGAAFANFDRVGYSRSVGEISDKYPRDRELSHF